MCPNRDELSAGLSSQAPDQGALVVPKAAPEAHAGPGGPVEMMAEPGDGFDFGAFCDGADTAEYVDPATFVMAMAPKEPEPAAILAAVPPADDIQALRAGRTLQQTFPMKNPEEALAIASMPHYLVGEDGMASIRMSHLEMRWMLADCDVTLANDRKDQLQGLLGEGTPVVRDAKGAVDPRAMADQHIQSLLEGGYIRAVQLTPDERRFMMDFNEALVEDLPASWSNFQENTNKRVAYELTDEGITAGRSIRSWDGKSNDAGLVRLPDGAPMPKAVATEVTAISIGVMENRALAGMLKPGEMGAFLKAELSNIDYGRKMGADPEIVAGQVDVLARKAHLFTLEQVSERIAGEDAPMRSSETDQIIQAARAIINSLPETRTVNDPETGQAYTQVLDLPSVRNEISALEGARIAVDLVLFERAKSEEGANLCDPAVWAGASKGEDAASIRDGLNYARNWISKTAGKGAGYAMEFLAMAKGALSEKGEAVGVAMAKTCFNRESVKAAMDILQIQDPLETNN